MLGLLKRKPTPKGAAQKQSFINAGTCSKSTSQGSWAAQLGIELFKRPYSSPPSLDLQNWVIWRSFAFPQTGFP